MAKKRLNYKILRTEISNWWLKRWTTVREWTNNMLIKISSNEIKDPRLPVIPLLFGVWMVCPVIPLISWMVFGGGWDQHEQNGMKTLSMLYQYWPPESMRPELLKAHRAFASRVTAIRPKPNLGKSRKTTRSLNPSTGRVWTYRFGFSK